MPQKLKDKIYYEDVRKHDDGSPSLEEDRKPGKKVSLPYSVTHRKTRLQTLVGKFTRDQFNYSVDSALQRNSGENSHEDNCRLIREILESEAASFRDREEASQKDILKSIQNQKYG